MDERPIEMSLYQRPEPVYLSDRLQYVVERFWNMLSGIWGDTALPYTPPTIRGLRVLRHIKHTSESYDYDFEIIYVDDTTGIHYSARDA